MANRRDLILKYVSKGDLGIEIAPWFSPIAPKSEGYNVKTLDVFDTEELRLRCSKDPNISANIDAIEVVDFVAAASNIDEIVASLDRLGQYDYIISSHNFEHLPDPITFLQASARVLKKGGFLTMAIPDKRYTFDRWRSISNTSDLLKAFYEKRKKPSLFQWFNHTMSFYDAKSNALKTSLVKTFASLQSMLSIGHDEYLDVHVFTYTPQSFELIINELIAVDLISFDVVEIVERGGFEFFVHLRKVDAAQEANSLIDFTPRRSALYSQVFTTAGTAPGCVSGFPIPVEPLMTDGEKESFRRALSVAEGYFEFGSGGSTVWAVAYGVDVYGVESNSRLVDALQKELGAKCHIEWADIGPIGDWGSPIDLRCEINFPSYSAAIRSIRNKIDLVLVNGRFRVACAMAAIMKISEQNNHDNARIFFHDFWDRKHYHVVLDMLDLVDRVDTTAIFKISAATDLTKVKKIYDEFKCRWE